MEKDEFFLKRIRELANLSWQRDIVTFSDFLNLNEQNIVSSLKHQFPQIVMETSGGYENAERQMVAFHPDALAFTWEYPITAIKIEPAYPKFAEKLFHLQQLANDAYKNNELRIRLSRKEKYEFALLLVIQWFRLPALRIENEEVFEDMMPKMVRLFQEGLALELNNPDIAKLRIQSKIKDKAVYHAESTFMNEDLLDRYSTLLSNNIWTFNYSVNGDFYTSDFPITVNPHVNNVKPICQGLAQYGAELTFPISKNLLLTIWDKDYFSDKESDECKMEVVHGRDLREANHIRTMYAQRQLFSNKNNFEFIDFISRIMPITKNPFR